MISLVFQALPQDDFGRLAPLFVRLAGVSEGDTVLDVGLGTGALTTAVATIPRGTMMRAGLITNLLRNSGHAKSRA